MIKPETILVTSTGRKLKILELIAMGGQGTVAKAKDLGNRQLYAVKIFHPQFAVPATMERIECLCRLRLHEISAIFAGPLETINDQGHIGYMMEYVAGKPMKELLESERCTFMELLVLAVSLAHAFMKLHARGIAHGDIRQANVLVERRGSVLRGRIIDTDNFNAQGAPKPQSYGDEMYLSPELYRAFVENRVRHPDIDSDRYELFVLMHEAILLKHPAAGWMEPPERFCWAMYEGVWRHHPHDGRPPADVKGYPPRVLNARLIDLFQRGIGIDAGARPTSGEWFLALLAALGEVYLCEACGGPCLIDASQTICPFCRRPYPTRRLALPAGRTLPLTNGYQPVGRNDVNGAPTVSRIHAVFRRIGPALYVENIGQNGTYRKSDAGWVRLEQGKPVMLNAGDVLRLADVEVRVE